MKSNDVYNPEAFTARVNYAAQCLIRRIDSRRRDTCFEMMDGDAVVVALVRRAAKNPRLKEAIARGWSELRDGFPVGWLDLAEKHAGADLPTLAAAMREPYRAHERQAAQILADGKALRCSALTAGPDRVHVLFRLADGSLVGRYMSHAAYDAIPLLENATPEDYAKHGELTEAPPAFSYAAA